MFLSTPASIAIYGGAAGGGKSFALLIECLRYIYNSKFGAIIFRKNANQIFAEGSLWDTAMSMYPLIGGVSRKTPKPSFVFPSKAKITFGHLERDEDVHGYQGSQIPLICFDELCHFSKYQFFYMLSRNRSTCGVDPYVRASCNPDASSFVAELISWWIDQETGYPIEERAGVIRYFIRRDDQIFWGDTPAELWEQFDLKTDEERDEPRSFTFIPSRLSDNQILMQQNPQYLANLKALATVERERLLFGNWKIMPAAGLYFKRSRVNMVDHIPDDVTKWVRAWDMAATEDKKNSRPEDGAAYTAGILIGKRKCGRYIVADVFNQRMNAADVRGTIRNTAISDKAKFKHVRIRLNQDPGQAGKDQAEQYIKYLSGFSVNVTRETGSKETRAEPFSAQWMGLEGSEMGNVDVLMAEWNDAYFSQLESFPMGKFKDMVDASGTAFNELMSGATSAPISKGAGIGVRPSPWKM